MLLTIGDWVLVGIIALIGIGVCIYLAVESGVAPAIINLIVVLLIIGGYMGFVTWYHKSTASGIRNYKDFQSEMSNGIYRELTITAEDGREIFRYEGKFDLERHEDGDDRYLRFETQDGKRYTISYGIQDTVLIIEKDAPTKSE